MKKYAYITVSKDQVIFEGPYHQAAVEEIKQIPHTEREWQPEEKRWLISHGYLDYLKSVIKKYYPNCNLVEGAVVTDLHTGEVTEQRTLFQEGS